MATAVRRGLAAGFVAGLLAGALALLVGEPALSRAVALEAPAGPGGMPRALQLVGLPLGTALVGLGVGALFGVASAWAVGRVEGSGWVRSLKLGAALLYGVVLLPALKYPANPPAVGDPATVGERSVAWVGLAVVGLVLAAATWAAGRALAPTALPPWARRLLPALGLAVATVLVLAVLPDPVADTGAVPAELVRSFRARSTVVQAALYGGTALVFGVLARRAERARAG